MIRGSKSEVGPSGEVRSVRAFGDVDDGRGTEIALFDQGPVASLTAAVLRVSDRLRLVVGGKGDLHHMTTIEGRPA